MKPIIGFHTFGCQVKMRNGGECDCKPEKAEKEQGKVDLLRQRVAHLEALLRAHHKFVHRRRMEETGVCTLCARYYKEKDQDINEGKYV